MSLRKNISSNMITSIVSIVSSFVTSIIIARGLGAEKQGEFAFYVLVFGLLANYGHIGISNANSYFMKNNKFTKENVINNNITILSLLILLYIVVVTVFKNVIFNDIKLLFLLFWIVYLAILIINNFLVTIYVAEEKNYVYNTYYMLSNVLKAITVVVLYYFFSINLLYLTIIYAFVEILKNILMLLNLKISYRPMINKQIVKDELKYGIPLYIANLCVYLNYKCDQFLIKYMVGNEKLGVYTIAVQLADLAFLFPEAIKTAFLGNLYNCPSQDEIKKRTQQIIKFTFYSTIMICIIGVFCKPLIAIIYGAEYIEAGVIMLVLFVGIIFASIGKVAPSYFGVIGKTKIQLIISFSSAIINIIFDFILIPLIGILGAAIASTISYIVMGVLYTGSLILKENMKFRDLLIINKEDVKTIFNMLKSGGRKK